MNIISYRILPLFLCLGIASIGPSAAAQKWTIKGKIKVEHVLPELATLAGSHGGIEGITVKVSARSKVPFGWGTWNSWGKVTTKSDGSFTVSENHGGDRRQFKISILFDSPKLRIKEGSTSELIKFDKNGFPIKVSFDLTDKDWHEVFNDKEGSASDGRKAGVIDLGDIFLKRQVVKEHGNLWTLYHKVFDLFEGYGSSYAFSDKVVVKYPMRLGSVSYANPLNNNIYIDSNGFDSGTLLHELVHRWQYERFVGEDSMAWQAIKHGSTHQTRENTTYVPGLEAVAEWSTYKILHELSDDKIFNFDGYSLYSYPDIPLTREYIGSALDVSEQSVANVDYTERGWHSLLNIMTHPYLDRVDFNRRLLARMNGWATASNKFSVYSTSIPAGGLMGISGRRT